MSYQEQLTELATSNVETVLRLAQISLGSAERLFKINLDAAKQALEQSADSAKALSSVKDLQEAITLRNKLAEAATESATAYGRTVYEATSQVQAELSGLFEERVSGFNKTLVSALDKAAKSAPAGTDVAVAAVKSSVAATAAAVDSLTKAAKQVADFADASVKAATTATADAVKTATKKAATAN
ncbi:phasin family protein [Chitinivorax sp. PXF-14]|uniref:phasin family protein n=1 Tax=Chitinivorax sp. PXF-14 TaxID=3230488 RepID=UPI0034668092